MALRLFCQAAGGLGPHDSIVAAVMPQPLANNVAVSSRRSLPTRTEQMEGALPGGALQPR